MIGLGFGAETDLMGFPCNTIFRIEILRTDLWPIVISIPDRDGVRTLYSKFVISNKRVLYQYINHLFINWVIWDFAIFFLKSYPNL